MADHADAPTIVFTWQVDDAPAFLLSREWLVTNGLGGYASGTLLGPPTRRYHGLFIPNLPAPKGRVVLIPRLDDLAIAGDRTVRLGGAEYADGSTDAEAHRVLVEFRQEWRIPTWRFEVSGRLLEKRIVMPHGYNTVYVEYRLVGGEPIRLQLRPYVTSRMHDGPLGGSPGRPFKLMVSHGRYELMLSEDVPVLRFCLRPSWGDFVADEQVSRQVLYRVERDRGLDHVEDLYSPGCFTLDLRSGESVAFVASIEPWERLDVDGSHVVEAEQRRLEQLLMLAPPRLRRGPASHLVLAADQFIISPSSRPEEKVLAQAAGQEVCTIVAGYHWFTDWGRDTMISLEGLTLCTGRHREARAILRTFAGYIHNGLLPNLFPEGQRTALYNTADATFWYFHALERYVEATGDQETLRLLYPALRSIVEHHRKGTDFGIGVDPCDGLVKAGAEGCALTWMDAKVDGWVVTPRRGKPVEIQALWYNALRLMEVWAEELGEPSDDYRELAEQAAESFNARFWFESGGYLYDVIDGEQGDDPSLRPNQIFAISLRFPILEEPRWRSVLETVADRLLTPVGLRSLEPGHRDYQPYYVGDLRARDAAYHQGTVWAWLIGHFLDAWRKVHPNDARERTMLKGLEAHLREAGIGTISEIFDATPPFTPRGCIAQAWSVAEVLRALYGCAGG